MNKLHVQAQQLFNLLILLIVGKYVAHIYLTWVEIVGILFFTLGSEHLLLYAKNKRLIYFSFSALSTAIGVILMMVTPHYLLYFFIIFLALLQKHYLQYNRQHFFNPSNFALITGLLFFYKDTHIALGQLGDNFWLGIGVIGLALTILYRVSRWVVPIAFTLFYILLQYFMIVSTDPVVIMDDIYHRFYSVSFIVFILFMLTDPKTTPIKIHYQVIFSLLMAFGASYLDYSYGFRVQHLFMVLFILTPFVVFLENYHKSTNKIEFLFFFFTVIFLVLSAIITIELQPPYYFEMDS